MMRILKYKNWVLPNTYADLDFCNKRYYGGYVDEKAGTDKSSLLSCGGAYAGTAYTPQKSGILLSGTANNRITDMGLFIDGSRTNICLWSRDLTNAAWVATSATVLKDQVGNDNTQTANSCSSILATGANATVLQSFTQTSTPLIGSAYVKRLIGSGTVNMTIDNGATWTPVTFGSSGYAWVQVPQQTLANPVFGFQIVTSGDEIAVDFCQLEKINLVTISSAEKASTPIVTTSAAVSRGNEAHYLGTTQSSTPGDGARLLLDFFSNGKPWSIVASFNGDFSSAAPLGPAIIASDMTNPVSINCGGGTSGFGGFTNNTANFCNIGRGNWNIGAVSCNGQGIYQCLNGRAPSAINTTGTKTPNPNALCTHFNIFNNGNGGPATLHGSVGRYAFIQADLNPAQMQLYTDLSGPFATFN